jgi:pyruvate dehydrogenase E1 component
VAVIMHHGLKRMVEKQDNVYYYITLLNENYPMPGLKPGTEEQIIKGMYLLQGGDAKAPSRACNLLGSGTILRESIAAQELLEKDWGVRRQRVELPELQRAGARRPGRRALEPAAPPTDAARALRGQQLEHHAGPVVASTDYMKPTPSRSAPSSRRAAPTRCWAPTASAAATSAASCASTSR